MSEIEVIRSNSVGPQGVCDIEPEMLEGVKSFYNYIVKHEKTKLIRKFADTVPTFKYIIILSVQHKILFKIFFHIF